MLRHQHPRPRNARDNRSPDLLRVERIDQDREPSDMLLDLRFRARNQQEAAEMVRVVFRFDDRVVDRQDIGTMPFRSAVVAHPKDARLPLLVGGLRAGPMPPLLGLRGVHEGVVGGGRNHQPLARLHLLVRIAHHASDSDPQRREIAFRVDLLDVDGHRLFHQNLLVFRVGVTNPEVLPGVSNKWEHRFAVHGSRPETSGGVKSTHTATARLIPDKP